MDEPQQTNPDPRLAASLAEGFIQAGVRAVIAAGWAVDDEAGRTFARTFYGAFLDGVDFGNAVKAARRAVLDQHPHTNTWGAYQCYGNPDYRFTRADSIAESATTKPFVALTEALQALRTLAASARSIHLGDEKRIRDEMGQLRKMTVVWERNAEVLACYAEICAELLDFEQAISLYRQALASVPATAALSIVEQLANLLTRSAASRMAQGTAMTEVLVYFEEAESWLEWLDKKLEPSRERSALWGALHKRRAIYDAMNRKRHLKRAEEAYRRAAELAKKSAYADLNAIALRFVLSRRRDLPELRALIDERVAALSPLGEGDRDFWSIIASPDTLLHAHVIHGNLADARTRAQVIDGYRDARLAGPSPREWASVRDHVEFLATMVKAGLPRPDPPTAEALRAVLDSMQAPQSS
jgi:tetratricopeptide (TPR) repeat protein